MIRSALLYLRPNLEAAGVMVQKKGLDAMVPVIGDAAQIQIAVVNLLRNALEALADTPEPTLAVCLEQIGGRAVLVVADNGPGFMDAAAALTPLETSKPQGSGLGLFVVQSTMANHRGSVALGRSALGGAEVRLSFPEAGAAPKPPQEPLPGSG